MAYENFKPTIWSQYIQRELEKKCKLVKDCWSQFEGEAKKGKTVKILGVGSPTIGTYSGESIGAPETIDGTEVLLNIDQAKFFNFMVDDVDKAQSIPGLMEQLMKEATHKLALASDSYVASLAANHDLNNGAGSAITTAANAKKAIDAGLLALRENDVDIEDNVVIEIAPFLYQLFKDNLVELKTANDELIKKGVMGTYDGAEVKLCNNLYNADGMYHNMIRTKKAIAFARQVQETEAYRPEGFFSDAVKGLDVYGAKIVRPKELYVLKASK
jgi:hypothetical protein